MKLIVYLFIITICPICCKAQQIVTGRVLSATDSMPLPGATIKLKIEQTGTITDQAGKFKLRASNKNDVLIISFVGFQPYEVRLPTKPGRPLTILLEQNASKLDQVVVSTGYYQVPQERSTGSFTYISEELLNRSTSTDIISRLEGVTSGLAFDRRRGPADPPSLRVRGVSTIWSNKNPLIVIDNFPYEGDINNINPNDVESISILKDAAAASIWGVRAGNGVIVVRTKNGRYNQPARISLHSSITIGEKPDLFYSSAFLPSPEFIEVERILFDRGFYQADESNQNLTPLSPAVELLIKKRNGLISAGELETRLLQLKQQDVRRDAEKYLYQSSANQQYSLNISGGSSMFRYFFSGGLDQNRGYLTGDQFNRFTLKSNNTLKLADKLHIHLGLNYMQSRSQNNGLPLNNIRFSSNRLIYPYAQLSDEKGTALSVIRDYRQSYIENAGESGLLDWRYRPLEEKSFNDNINNSYEVRVNTAVDYRLLKGLKANVKYQYQRIFSEGRRLYAQDSYYVRNLVNQYTQEDGERIFPHGGILNLRHNKLVSHAARGQLNYNYLQRRHGISAFIGMEVRQVISFLSGFELYGYDKDVLTHQSRFDYLTRYPVRPRGGARLPAPQTPLSEHIDRFVSYYANASYTYKDRYTLSGSSRWDASNLFGVRANQRGIPLWSAGLSWQLSNEPFYGFSDLPYLRLRATYGYNGNINKSVTAFITTAYRTDRMTGLRRARIIGPGNPGLRWEKTTTFNVGIDLENYNSRIKGTFEYYIKHGSDLLGVPPVIDPTTGYESGLGTSFLVNYADMRNQGFDVEISTINNNGKLQWRTDFLFSYVRNKVVSYLGGEEDITGFASNFGIAPQEGQSLDAFYSLPWAGLDPQTGDPMVRLNGVYSKDYSEYRQSIQGLTDLVYNGVTFPPYFGSVRNTLNWKGFSLSVNITGKFGYHFRRSSIQYESLFEDWKGHRDFLDRWQKPGDEQFTQIPSMPNTPVEANRDWVYYLSEVLVERGDHIRLQDINLSYTLNKKRLPDIPLKNIHLFLFVRNPGFIWRASKSGLDPDQPEAVLPSFRSISFGLNATF